MPRHILDRSEEADRDRGAAHVAFFCALACTEGSDSAAAQDGEFVFGAESAVLDREQLVTRLAALPKPVWVDASSRGGRLAVQAGPLKDRPDIQLRYDRWHEPKTTTPHYPPPADDAGVLLSTETHGLRARWRDFVQYQRDYFPTGYFSYGMSDVGGISPQLREFSSSELAGVARTISVMRPGPVLWLDEQEQ